MDKQIIRVGLAWAILSLGTACSTQPIGPVAHWEKFKAQTTEAPTKRQVALANESSGGEALDETNINEIEETVNIPAAVPASEVGNNGQGIRSKACGDLLYGESAHTALDPVDVFYSLRVTCASVPGANRNGTSFIKIDRQAISSGQLRYLTIWRRQAAMSVAKSVSSKKREKGKYLRTRNGLAYICLRGTFNAPLCAGDGRASVAIKVDNFTSKIDVFNQWQ